MAFFDNDNFGPETGIFELFCIIKDIFYLLKKKLMSQIMQNLILRWVYLMNIEHFALDQRLCLNISFCPKMPVFGAKSSI
jgi:hypothetical protein